jgi:cytoskeletal protein CcmA (bactofilin family)
VIEPAYKSLPERQIFEESALSVVWAKNHTVSGNSRRCFRLASIKNLHYAYAAASGIPPRRNRLLQRERRLWKKIDAKSVEVTTMSTDAIRPPVTTPASSSARLGAGLHVKGDISGREDLHVDGNIEGMVQLEDCKLTVGASAKLTGDVFAREVVVHGSVKGNLRVRDRIEIKKDGSVVGELTTQRILIEDGASFKGSIEIDRKTTDASPNLDKPTYARAVAATVDPKTKYDLALRLLELGVRH